ncbi:MAG: hypothetical protein ACLFU2_00855 [Opitutales bacterium]
MTRVQKTHYDYETPAALAEVMRALPRHAARLGIHLQENAIAGATGFGPEAESSLTVLPVDPPIAEEGGAPAGCSPQALELRALPEDAGTRLRLCISPETSQAYGVGIREVDTLVDRLRTLVEAVTEELGQLRR